MNLISKYNFKEAELGSDFAQSQTQEFKDFINKGVSFVAMSMPGVGASYFLKYLTMQDFAYFIHVDMYSLPSLTKHEFYRLLLIELGGKPGNLSDDALFSKSKEILKKLSEKQKKIVIIFSRFDQLKKELDWNFLSNIQSLSTVAPGIVLIFTSVKPLNEVAPEAVSGGNLNFYSQDLYFKPFSSSDLKKLYKMEPVKSTSEADLEKLIDLAGGHNQLLHILLNSHKQQNLTLDQNVLQQMKSLIGYLDYQQSKQVQKIALGRKIEEVDEYLLGVGMVKKVGSKFELFTPLLSQYIKENLSVKLPAKEAKLFKLLRKNMGSTVPKEEIFNEVWGEDSENATNWALDALIYRLRKHPFIKTNGYIIESQKKVGYILIQT